MCTEISQSPNDDSANFSFSALRDDHAGIETYQRATHAYQSVLERHLNNSSLFPIALDTNVLLNELNLNDAVSEGFSLFLSTIPDNIVIPGTVREEFERHVQDKPTAFDSSGFTKLAALTEDEKQAAIQDFKTWTQLSELPLPGTGDIRGKAEYPFGDFFILLEILKFMAHEDTDCVFLTNDIFKGDWLSRELLPHLHLIELIYQLTGHSLIILPARKYISHAFDPEESHGVATYFNAGKLYKTKFYQLWHRVTNVPVIADNADNKILKELRRVKKTLALSGDIAHNSYLNDSWLVAMERLISKYSGPAS